VKAAAPSVPASSSPSKNNRSRHPPDRQGKGGPRAALFSFPIAKASIVRSIASSLLQASALQLV
ncbi:hypothetical protein, partial [Mesorhizobium sp.]|uniref:hypothetical protein n=1 Tax=Mesorhizobium sp. TaxID=1871066 RepID=UPI0025B8B03C